MILDVPGCINVGDHSKMLDLNHRSAMKAPNLSKPKHWSRSSPIYQIRWMRDCEHLGTRRPSTGEACNISFHSAKPGKTYSCLCDFIHIDDLKYYPACTVRCQSDLISPKRTAHVSAPLTQQHIHVYIRYTCTICIHTWYTCTSGMSLSKCPGK